MNYPMSESHEDWDEADYKYGWKFGCDGLMGFNYVCEFLSLSHEAVEKLIMERKLRAREPAPTAEKYKVLFCRRSVLEHAASIER